MRRCRRPGGTFLWVRDGVRTGAVGLPGRSPALVMDWAGRRPGVRESAVRLGNGDQDEVTGERDQVFFHPTLGG